MMMLGFIFRLLSMSSDLAFYAGLLLIFAVPLLVQQLYKLLFGAPAAAAINTESPAVEKRKTNEIVKDGSIANDYCFDVFYNGMHKNCTGSRWNCSQRLWLR